MGCVTPLQRTQDSLLSQTRITHNPLTQKTLHYWYIMLNMDTRLSVYPELPGPAGCVPQECSKCPFSAALCSASCPHPLHTHTKGRQEVNEGRENTKAPSEMITSAQLPLYFSDSHLSGCMCNDFPQQSSSKSCTCSGLY